MFAIVILLSEQALDVVTAADNMALCDKYWSCNIAFRGTSD